MHSAESLPKPFFHTGNSYWCHDPSYPTNSTPATCPHQRYSPEDVIIPHFPFHWTLYAFLIVSVWSHASKPNQHGGQQNQWACNVCLFLFMLLLHRGPSETLNTYYGGDVSTVLIGNTLHSDSQVSEVRISLGFQHVWLSVSGMHKRPNWTAPAGSLYVLGSHWTVIWWQGASRGATESRREARDSAVAARREGPQSNSYQLVDGILSGLSPDLFHVRDRTFHHVYSRNIVLNGVSQSWICSFFLQQCSIL